MPVITIMSTDGKRRAKMKEKALRPLVGLEMKFDDETSSDEENRALQGLDEEDILCSVHKRKCVRAEATDAKDQDVNHRLKTTGAVIHPTTTGLNAQGMDAQFDGAGFGSLSYTDAHGQSHANLLGKCPL